MSVLSRVKIAGGLAAVLAATTAAILGGSAEATTTDPTDGSQLQREDTNEDAYFDIHSNYYNW